MTDLDVYATAIREVIGNNSTSSKIAEKYIISERDGYICVRAPIDINSHINMIIDKFGAEISFNSAEIIGDYIIKYNLAVSEINADMQIIVKTVNSDESIEEDMRYPTLIIPLAVDNLDDCLKTGSEKLAELYYDICFQLFN